MQQQQQQLCPRCKFRLTSVKAICPTCGLALQMTRKPENIAPVASKPIQQQQVMQQQSNVNAAAAVRKVQAAAQPSGGGGSFWRTFIGLDPLPSDKSDRDDRAYGET